MGNTIITLKGIGESSILLEITWRQMVRQWLEICWPATWKHEGIKRSTRLRLLELDKSDWKNDIPRVLGLCIRTAAWQATDAYTRSWELGRRWMSWYLHRWWWAIITGALQTAPQSEPLLFRLSSSIRYPPANWWTHPRHLRWLLGLITKRKSSIGKARLKWC